MQLNLNKLEGTEFQKKVWKEIYKIPKGQTKTYKEIAILVGSPKSSRAVANACGKNPFGAIEFSSSSFAFIVPT